MGLMCLSPALIEQGLSLSNVAPGLIIILLHRRKAKHPVVCLKRGGHAQDRRTRVVHSRRVRGLRLGLGLGSGLG